MENDWKTEIKTCEGIHIFFLERIGPIMGQIRQAPDGFVYISEPRAVVSEHTGKQGLALLPGKPDKLLLFSKPLFGWEVKDKSIREIYTKMTSNITIATSISERKQ